MRIILSILVAALFGALPAQAQVIEKLTVENIGATLVDNDLRFVETTDNRGFPLIQIETEGTFTARNINIFFYGCDATGCEDITLYSWYEAPRPVSSQTIYEWNDIFRQARNWSRAYVDEEGDPTLVMNINATGGIGPDALQILVNTYLLESLDFAQFIVGDAQ